MNILLFFAVLSTTEKNTINYQVNIYAFYNLQIYK